MIGPLAMKIETARFARTLGTMLKSGVPVMGALAVVGDTMTNQAIGQAVARLSEGVKRGGTIAAGMQEQAPFPVLAIHMVRVGEETGRLEDMLIKVAETFESDVGTDLKRVLRLLEPVDHLRHGGTCGIHRRRHDARDFLHQRDSAMRRGVGPGRAGGVPSPAATRRLS